ncbi:MAG: hypothetical protein LBM74_03375 [Oscillospiraceae bacterium]|jgi:vacuolar-type H+-ATPase subunit H|nr:hypothetical protein [Oscillospiraceae bacterium]
MSVQLLESVEAAEAKAEALRAEAQKEAREILQATDAACAANERQAALEHRQMARRILDDAKEAAERHMAERAGRQAEQNAAQMQAARAKIDQAAACLLERVMRNGSR